MKPKRVDIIIVNWNSKAQLAACVDSICEFIPAETCNICIIDNGSTDDSVDILRALENMRVIKTGENLGFGKACNLGAQESNSEFLLFLNPDSKLYSETVQVALAYMEAPANASVGICGVQLRDETDQTSKSCTRFPSASDFVCHAVGLDRLFPRLGHFMSEWAHDSTQQVDHVMGAFFLVRRETFETLNGFDERFFVYLEDLDFSFRAKQAGWNSVYLTEAQAFHLGGGTSNQVKAMRLFYSLRSQLLYAFKHFSLLNAWLVALMTLFVEPVTRSVFALGCCSWTSLRETWAGYGMLWKWLPKWVFKGVTR